MPDSALTQRTHVSRLIAMDVGAALLSAVLLVVALEPLGQFYLAWIGLVPLLWRIRSSRSTWHAAVLAYVAGVFYFLLGFHWLFFATPYGYLVVALFLSLYWAFAGALTHRVRTFGPAAQVLSIAAIWTSTEFLRGTIMGGFPWLNFGHSQTPFLLVCQVAGISGVAGVTAWVVLVNALIVRLLVERRRCLRAGIVVVSITLVLIGYGWWRIGSVPEIGDRIDIALVQSNHVHSREGAKIVKQQDQIDYLLAKSRDLRADIIAWPETTMPALNVEARTEPGLGAAPMLNRTLAQLSDLARDRDALIVTGGYYVGGFRGEIGKRLAADIRNSVYVISHEAAATSPDQRIGRYDKIRLVPFAEYLPFQGSDSFLHRVMTHFATAAYASGYRLTPATERTVFHHGSVRFVTPICFEDTIAPLVRSFFKPDADGSKRADLILNISNDGWFNAAEKRIHLQIARFRSIENRVPSARVSNTGQSAFIDSGGRITSKLEPFIEGVLTSSIRTDPRLTFYTRFGDVFAWLCVIGSALACIPAIWGKKKRNREEG